MSTHSTLTWLAIREHHRGEPSDYAEVDVATDTLRDQCVRLTLANGEPHGPQGEADAHMNPDQAELIGMALIEAARIVRERRHDDPAWSAVTVEQTGWRP